MWYPKAEKHPHVKEGGSQRGGNARGVLHTTETKSWAGAPWYHIEYNPKTHEFRQYRSFARSAYGLRHPAATPETNRQGDYCIQLSITDYAANAGTWDDQTYADIAEFMEWCRQMFGIKLDSRFPVGHGGSAYGESGTARMIWDEWLNLNSWCGHQEVPSNSHWDPGRIDYERLFGDEELTTEELELLNWVRENRSFIDKFIHSVTVGTDEQTPDIPDDPSGPTFPQYLIQYYRHGRKDLEVQVATIAERLDEIEGSGNIGDVEVETVEVVTGVVTETREVLAKVPTN